MNLNTPDYISATTRRILEHLRHVPAAPGVTIGGGAESGPRDPMVDLDEDDDKDDPDERDCQRALDARVRPSNDYGPDHGDTVHRDVQAGAEAPAGPQNDPSLRADAMDSDASYLATSLCSVRPAEGGKVVKAEDSAPSAPAEATMKAEPKEDEMPVDSEKQPEDAVKTDVPTAEAPAREETWEDKAGEAETTMREPETIAIASDSAADAPSAAAAVPAAAAATSAPAAAMDLDSQAAPVEPAADQLDISRVDEAKVACSAPESSPPTAKDADRSGEKDAAALGGPDNMETDEAAAAGAQASEGKPDSPAGAAAVGGVALAEDESEGKGHEDDASGA